MKLLTPTILLCMLLLGMPGVAAEVRGTFAPSPETVTPLLEGMQVPNSALRTPDGSPVSLHALTMQGPSVLLFYRGGWCPYCNRQLAELKTIEQQLTELGYQILAVSPQSTEALNKQALESEFAARLYTDASLESLRQFGIGFYLDEETQQRYEGHNIDLTLAENGQAVLPAPALFIVDSQGIIQFSYVNPDYRARPSASMVLAVAEAIAADSQ